MLVMLDECNERNESVLCNSECFNSTGYTRMYITCNISPALIVDQTMPITIRVNMCRNNAAYGPQDKWQSQNGFLMHSCLKITDSMELWVATNILSLSLSLSIYILKRTSPYTRICLEENLQILKADKENMLLNKRAEIVSKCHQLNKFYVKKSCSQKSKGHSLNQPLRTVS